MITEDKVAVAERNGKNGRKIASNLRVSSPWCLGTRTRSGRAGFPIARADKVRRVTFGPGATAPVEMVERQRLSESEHDGSGVVHMVGLRCIDAVRLSRGSRNGPPIRSSSTTPCPLDSRAPVSRARPTDGTPRWTTRVGTASFHPMIAC